MKINEITLNPQMVPEGDPLFFRVGSLVVEGGHRVEKITFHSKNNVFNKGRETGMSSYAVFLEGNPERRIIMANTVAAVVVAMEKKRPEEIPVPELPE